LARLSHAKRARVITTDILRQNPEKIAGTSSGRCHRMAAKQVAAMSAAQAGRESIEINELRWLSLVSFLLEGNRPTYAYVFRVAPVADFRPFVPGSTISAR
jgi:hypothetical protein